MTTPNATKIDRALAEFVTGPVAIVVATRGAGDRPHLVRGYAVQMSDAGKRLNVHVPTAQSENVREDIDANGHIAVVMSRVCDFKTYQFKGSDCEVGPAVPASTPALESYCEGFRSELQKVRLSRETSAGFLFSEYTRLTFTPSSGFEQTPGPSAGQPIGLSHE